MDKNNADTDLFSKEGIESWENYTHSILIKSSMAFNSLHVGGGGGEFFLLLLLLTF